MSRQGWNNLLRGMGVGLGIALLFASWYFSASYFGIQKQELFWVGILVAVVVTFAEFAWRKPGLAGNSTFKAIGIICYVYDIATNSLGILEAWGVTNHYFNNPVQTLMALFVGFIFAVIAEPMLSWGITGDAQADLISGVVKTLNGDDTPDGESGRSGGGKPQHHNQGHMESHGPNLEQAMGREARQNQNNNNRHPQPVPMGKKGNHPNMRS